MQQQQGQGQGSTIQDFNVLEKLGEGSFSSVYKVQRKSDGQYYAMKKVNISQQTYKERENALNEIRILASLDSPYIVEFKDSFLDSEGKTLYVIMEFASGGDLNSLLKQGKLKGGVEETEIWRVLTQITIGVKMLHDNNILHRDLKLANVFIGKSPEGNIYKIGDLNISKVTHGANARTQAGTPYYASPEVWKGEQYSWPCDIWSIGCIIYELAAQQPPFRAADLQSLSRRIQTGVYDPIPGKYSKDLSEVIKLMLQVVPRNRPSSDAILKNPIVIRNSGSLLVEEEVGGKKVAKLLQTIKLPYNLKQLKGNLPKANYENKIKRSSSQSGIRVNTDISQTPQPVKKQPEESKPPQSIPMPIPMPKPGQQQQQQQQQQQINKPPLLKPPMAQPPKPQQPQTPQQLQNKVQQQEQRLLGQQKQWIDFYCRYPHPPQSQVTPRAQSPRGNPQQSNQNRAAGMPSGMRRQYSAGPIQRR
ncbi:unnamed protein product (macronuclear) [Paramecium tetraurelia]|uniref:non-specific serine/threonine protein kinase n=1 Tax=Paramecium tetraurelia TaxID=5888 RepID=A0BDU4_PARTE|nr:uncharacterized protein GSPATT00027741001 [Paramecium tetraurelia]CAK56711.1 unnamed protein product [Paramecium tetraurelia]|eukprot:XP_001424109.1 hypothetical protein (macronuclear) [Paramecium tetraurelia strain d4-2]